MYKRQVILLTAACRDGEPASTGQRRFAGLPVRVPEDACKLVIVKAGAFERSVFPAKSEWFHQMQFAAGIGTQADDVPGVGRNLGLEQDDSSQGALQEMLCIFA